MLVPKDIKKILGISVNRVCELLNSGGFQVFRIGQSYRIYKHSFLQW
ncbi:helix-turn-helix domain-containing protein [Brevibacillus choshinensis]